LNDKAELYDSVREHHQADFPVLGSYKCVEGTTWYSTELREVS